MPRSRAGHTARLVLSVALFAGASAVLAACGDGGRPARPDDEAAARADAPDLALPAGPLVIVGGALAADNAPVYEAILARRAGDGPVCVVPTASGAPEESMASAVAALDGHGGPGTAVGILLAMDNAPAADDPALAARFDACSGFFFTGGQQSRVVDTFLPRGDTTAAYRALVGRFRAGAVIAGTSAGAAMMSGAMIAGGSSAEAIAHGVVPDRVVGGAVGAAAAPAASSEEEPSGVVVRAGMGLFPTAVLDQHFLARGRVGRLLVVALSDVGGGVGFGIDENTALVVDSGGARVVGASGVVIVDAREAERTRRGRGAGVRVTLAGDGDVIDLRTLEVDRPSDKTMLARAEEAPGLPDDAFARWAFLHLVAALSRAEAPEARLALDGATLVVTRGPGFTAFARDGEGVQGTPVALSAGPFLVDVVE